MKRLQLFEIEDQPWLPAWIRDALTDYLQFVTNLSRIYFPVVAKLKDALEMTGDQQVIDLCSGGAGPWLSLLPIRTSTTSIRVLLSDKYPNIKAFERTAALSQNALGYLPESVDATNVANQLAGFRTLFSSFHHFPPPQARAILEDAVRKRQGIGIFEGTQRSVRAVVLMLLTPLMVLLFTPFIRPFRWSRVIFTYLIPVIPVLVVFDGIVSCLRTYTPEEMNELIMGLPMESGYHWEVGELKAEKAPLPVTYLLGYPASPQ